LEKKLELSFSLILFSFYGNEKACKP